MRVLGVDGCPGGWVGALLEHDRISWHHGTVAALLALGADVVAIDIPIGMPVGAARRQCDLRARQLLGRQRSSVFLTPPRVVLDAASQADATRRSRAAGSAGVSIQTFHLLGRIAEVDELVRAGGHELVEVHPEVSLRRLAQLLEDPHAELPPEGRAFPAAVELAGKRTAPGREQRRALLSSWLPGLVLPHPRPPRAAADDCLDALAAAWSAQRRGAGQHDELGGDLDGAGVPMRIVL